MDNTHHRHNALDGELQLALAWQEELTRQQTEVVRRIEQIRERARAGRLMFSHGLENTRELLGNNPPQERTDRGEERAEARPSPAVATPGKVTPREDREVPYASPLRPEEVDKFRLFRPRSPNEGSREHADRLNAQAYLLARKHYEEGVRKRNANAEKIWKEMETREREAGLGDEYGTYPRQFCRHADPGPPGGDDDDGRFSHRGSSLHGHGRRISSHENNSREPNPGYARAGYGAGGPPYGGGPPSDPSDDGD